MQRGGPSRTQVLAAALAIIHFITYCGPGEALRSRTLRLFLGIPTAFAQDETDIPVDFAPGLNLFSMPASVPATADTCFELLAFQGGEAAVESITRLNPTSQLFEECHFASGVPAGTDFLIIAGDGYQVHMLGDTTVSFAGDPVCPGVDLQPEQNLIGIPSPPGGLSCFALLTELGVDSVASIQRFDLVTGAFEACTFFDTGSLEPAGNDFPILAGEAYVLSMHQAVASFNPNDPTACFVNQAPALDLIGDQTANLGTTLVFTLTGADPDCPTIGDDCNPEDADIDVQTLSVSPLPLPRNARFEPASGLFTFTPDVGQSGPWPFTFRLSDGSLADVETITVTVPAPAGVTSLRGQVLTTDSAPLPGVRLVLGNKDPPYVDCFDQATDPLVSCTDATGAYVFPNTPAGKQRLLIDGSTVDPLGTYATVPEMITLIEGAENILEPPIFLLPLDVASGDPIDPTQESIVDSSPIVIDGQTYPPVVMTVPAGTARREDTGELFAGSVHISSIPSPDLGPRPLPFPSGETVSCSSPRRMTSFFRQPG